MALVVFRLFFVVIFFGIVQPRILRLNSFNDDFISDGVDQVENQPSSLSANSSQPINPNTISILSAPNSCDHQYGFLPCAENAAGYIFQMLVYQGVLIFGEKQIVRGSKVLFNIIGAGKIGGVIFRILMSLPSMILMIVSGVFSSKATAQSQVSVGVGIYAGITVFSLTLQWGICVIYGRRDLPRSSTDREHTDASQSNCFSAKRKLINLIDTGVAIDQNTQRTAGIMLLSLIPYIIVQLNGIFYRSSGTLTALVVSSLSLVSYFVYQILNPWIQQRSLDFSKYEILRAGFLQHVQQQGQLVNEDGKLNTDIIKKLFVETDKDADKCLTRVEIEKLVLQIIETGKMKVDRKFAVSEVIQTFDFNNDGSINEEEFIKGCEKWIDETNRSSENSDNTSRNIVHELFQLSKEKREAPQQIDRIMSKILKHAETQLLKAESLITQDGKPNIDQIQSLFEKFDSDGDRTISKAELEKLITTVKFGEFQPNYDDIVKELFTDFDKDRNGNIDEPEFVEGLKRWLQKAVSVANTIDRTKTIDKFDEIMWNKVFDKWTLMISMYQVLLGIVILNFLGGPLMTSILQLSYAMGLPSFCISFVVVPLAMNARIAITTLLPASQKSERTASLTFSEIYGGVIMNNIAGLTTLLAIVYAKDLTWDFSAEVLTVFVVCAVVGFLAYTCHTYPLWTCILAIFLYPFSLFLFYFVQLFLSWN